MSASNLTDTIKSLSNSTINNSINSPVTTWETRLQAYWQYLFGYSIGSVLCILIICISIFSKHITGDYKWFVLNQALANFFGAIGNLLNTLVISIWYSEQRFFQLLVSADPPLWVNIYDIAMGTLRVRIGRYATTIAVFATVFNRWMAIVMPDHYQKFMSARLIVLYCILCHLVTILTYPPVLKMLNIANFELFVSAGYFLTPWLLSIILSTIILFKLWNHMRTTTTITDKRRLQESRMVLYSLMIQLVVLFLEKIPNYFFVIVANVAIFTRTKPSAYPTSLLTVFARISPIIDMYSSAYTCIIILITMRPYRRAVLSLISPITKFCQHHLKPNIEPATTDNRVTPKPNVVNVQPAWRANSL